MIIHEDARRKAYCDLFSTPTGDVNLFIINPGQRTAWHRHKRQTDEFRVLRGAIRFGVVDTQGIHSYHVLAKPDWMVKVPPYCWHGYENLGNEPAWLLMYLDQKYSPDDEERTTEEEITWHR